MAIAMAALMLHSLRLIRFEDKDSRPMIAVTLAFFVILLAETSISYITSPTLWTWFFVLLIMQAEMTERWQVTSDPSVPDPDELDLVSR